ncbi:putative RNA polymerase sigma factor FecI [Sphingomonas sp. S2M10]|uniref:sigma-70 family RNA polymerase sigma factor n=1 Tax=Sphingomonas sp. S2M10 TaxID=2705010 RepID=UPI0014576ABB|nr:putative RNA polymerase sigma factor FecI [Sphingomonas sp. S2M10]
MSVSARDALIALLVAEYGELRRRLTSRLGSADAANEALQDTYVRLRRAEELAEVRNPRSYLLRMAMNIGINRFRSEARHLSAADVAELVELPDDSPDPEQIIGARADLKLVEQALEGLPERRRAMFRGFWVENAGYRDIALQFNVSERTVRNEILLATRYLHKVTDEIFVDRLQKSASQPVPSVEANEQ